ncbi:MAG: hypothetical protein V5B35_06500 [Candidatus Accumulibacter necessarius]|jgi:hypothetical protein|uniref:hypothetical protein n=1 Tax=Candidatus Accumulibacter necessarius TaxID=2954386 RepID=UPI002FC37DBA
MRKLIFMVFIALGALIGLISATNSDWGTRLVMMGVGALFGAPIGGALASIGRKGRPLEWEENPLPGMGTTPKDLAANYWRDKGHPPFMKPSEAEPDKHMFDPDRLG